MQTISTKLFHFITFYTIYVTQRHRAATRRAYMAGSRLAKGHKRQRKTWHIAVRKGTNGNAKGHKREKRADADGATGAHRSPAKVTAGGRQSAMTEPMTAFIKKRKLMSKDQPFMT